MRRQKYVLLVDRSRPCRTVPAQRKNGNVNAASRVMINGVILQGAREEICYCRSTDVEEIALNSVETWFDRYAMYDSILITWT